MYFFLKFNNSLQYSESSVPGAWTWSSVPWKGPFVSVNVIIDVIPWAYREWTVNFNMEISQDSSRYVHGPFTVHSRYVHANFHKITFKLTLTVRYVAWRSRARNETCTVFVMNWPKPIGLHRMKISSVGRNTLKLLVQKLKK